MHGDFSDESNLTKQKADGASPSAFILAQGVGFEPTWVAPNGFQDRLVMTTSISLRMYNMGILAQTAGCVKCEKTFCRRGKD